MGKSYTQIASDHKLMDIVEFLHQQTGPVSAAVVASGTGMAYGTVMSHLAGLRDRGWVEQVGEGYEPGRRIAGMWAAYKMGIETKIGRLQADLRQVQMEA